MKQHNQMQQLSALMSAASESDRTRVEEVIYQVGRHTAGRDRPDEEIRSAAMDMSSGIMSIANNSTLQQMGISSRVLDTVLGGTSALAMAQPLSGAMLNMKGTTNRVTEKDMRQLMSSLMSEYSVGGGLGENVGFTRGLSTGDMGSLANEMSRSGLLNAFGGGPSTVNGQLGQFNAAGVKAQLGEMAKVVDAMRDLTGDQDSPIPKIIESLQMITGGALGKVSAQRMENMVYEASSLADELNMSSDVVQNDMMLGANRTRSLGYGGMAGAQANLSALTGVAATKRIRTDQGITGGASPREILDAVKRREVGAVNSIGVNQIAALLRAMDAGAITEDSELGKTLAGIKNGTASTEAAQSLLKQVGTDVGARSVWGGAGIDSSVMRTFMNDKAGQGAVISKYGLSEQLASAAIAQDEQDALTTAIARQAGISKEKAAGLAKQVFGGSGRSDDVTAALGRGLGSDLKAQAVMAAFRTERGDSLDTVVQMYGTKSLEERKRIREENQADTDITKMLKDNGMGGTTGVVRNVLNAAGALTAGKKELKVDELINASFTGTKLSADQQKELATSIVGLKEAQLGVSRLGSGASADERNEKQKALDIAKQLFEAQSKLLITIQAETEARKSSDTSYRLTKRASRAERALQGGDVDKAQDLAEISGQDLAMLDEQGRLYGGDYGAQTQAVIKGYAEVQEELSAASKIKDPAKREQAEKAAIQKMIGLSRTGANLLSSETIQEQAKKKMEASRSVPASGSAPAPGDAGSTAGSSGGGLNVSHSDGSSYKAPATETRKLVSTNLNTNTTLQWGEVQTVYPA
jgi:hypothetical protein